MLLLGAAGNSAGAAPIWLQPRHPTATPGAQLAVDLAAAPTFGADPIPLPSAVAAMSARLADADVEMRASPIGAASPEFEVTVVRPGIAALTVELAPRTVEHTGAEIEARLRELHAGVALRDEWAAVPAPRRWREIGQVRAKAFVRVGEPPPADHSWSVPARAGLDVVTERDPTALHENDELPVRVYRDGAPAAGIVLAFVSRGETREHIVISDETGRASAPLDCRGSWLVQATELRRVRSVDHEWESAAASIVLAVDLPPR
jgi:hypothetical protein